MPNTKTFISVIPFQEPGKLNPAVYTPHGNSKLEYGETRFPIVPVINGYAKKGDSIRVIAVYTENSNVEHNFENFFKEEISGIVAAKELSLAKIETIRTADSEDIDTQLKLFSDLIGAIGEDEELYACITYGTKPTPILVSIALNNAYRIRKKVELGCVVYGRYIHNDSSGNNGIYDTTALIYIDSIMGKLIDIKAPNPEKAIRSMLGVEGSG